jgi:neutral ceramidase
VRRLLVLALFATLALGAAPASAPPAAGTILAGAAVADITPELGSTMLGYVRPDLHTDGVAQRLVARALVLDDGATKVALLAVDLGFALEKDALVARLAGHGFDHSNVFYATTHTHSGPEELAAWQVDQIAAAVLRADAARRPARLAWADTRVTDVARNRSIEAHLANHGLDLFYGQGHAVDDADGVEHTVDDTLRLLRVDGIDGQPIAAWIDFPVHLTATTNATTLWSADIAGTATHYTQVGLGGVAMFSQGSHGDLTPVFDGYNPHAVIDRLGHRIAEGAIRAWHDAGTRLGTDVPLDVRWTRTCFCGQEVEPGKAVSAIPMWGVAFFGGSEDGPSPFHEPLATEGRRRPAELADPVHGRKLLVGPTPYEREPEYHAVRIGEKVLLGAPGEVTVEAARRIAAASHAIRPAGVTDTFVVSLVNDFIAYVTTPEEYDMQHYEGGHTVFGKYTMLQVRDSLATLTAAMAADAPAPAPSSPAGTSTGFLPGATTFQTSIPPRPLPAAVQPPATAERMQVVDLVWDSPHGRFRDRAHPDDAFIVVERSTPDGWVAVDDDRGVRIVWQEVQHRTYAARYDLASDLPLGAYRLRVRGAGYEVVSDEFTVTPSTGLRLLGVDAEQLTGNRTRLVFRAQNPPPHPDRSLLRRDVSPTGGTVAFTIAGRQHTARWDPASGGWAATLPGDLRGANVVVAPGGLRDGLGNVSGAPADVTVGTVADAEWPPNMGVNGGRPVGPLGIGEFPM